MDKNNSTGISMEKNTIYSVIIDSVDFADIGLCNCSLSGEIQYMNRSFINLFSLTGVSANGNGIAGLMLESKVPALIPVLERVVSEKKLRGAEIAHGYPPSKWFLVDAYIYSNNDSQPDSVLFIVRDITFYKNLEYELIISNKNLYSLIDTSPDIVYRLNPEGNITFISESIRDYGYEPDELAGKSILTLVHPDDRERARFRLNERRAGDRKTRLFEVRLLSKADYDVMVNIEEREVKLAQFFLISAEGIYITTSMEENSFVGTQGIARDITNRRNVEHRLKNFETRWHDILDSLEDGYYEVDLAGKFTFVNKYLAAIIGIETEEAINRNYSEFFLPDDAKKIFKAFNNLYKTGIPSKMVDLIITRNDGKKRNVEGSISLIKSDNGGPVGFRGIMRDITVRMKIDKELARAKKLEAIGILAGGIAHDFNNALTAIMGNLSLAKMEIPHENKGLLEILNDAEAASFKIMELTKKLSTFARGGRPVKKTLDINDLIYETVNSVLSGFEGEYTLSIDNELHPVDIDEIQMNHAIENILRNAVEALNNKGRIIITAKNIHVDRPVPHHDTILQPGDYVMLSIEDDGPGIAHENLDKIFDPYYSTKDAGGGMGLATSFAIIMRHHGYIDVKSKLNEGVKFSIYLPVHVEF